MGDQLGGSVSDSISLTLKKRIGLAKKSIYEIKYIVEDCRSEVVGGLETGLLLWEVCVIPMLLYNSGTWLLMKKSDMDLLEKLQNQFYNQLLSIQKCPALAMTWDLGGLTMSHRILKEKLLLYHHICMLPQSSLSYKVRQIQERFHFPSLKDEVFRFLSEHRVCDVTIYNKKQWRSFVKEKITEANRNFLSTECQSIKKWTTSLFLQNNSN